MRFDPKREEDLPKFGPLDPGDYDGTVIEARDRVSSSGNEMIHIVVRFRSDDGRTREVHDYLLAAMEHKLRHFCVTTGLTAEYEAGELTAAHCAGQDVRAKLKVRKQEGYDDKNDVADYLPRKQLARPGPAPQQKPGGEGAFPVAARNQARDAFLVPWTAFVAASPDAANMRDVYWKQAYRDYFGDKSHSTLSPVEWSNFAKALRTNWTPSDGFKKAAEAAAVSPVSQEAVFEEADIPF